MAHYLHSLPFLKPLPIFTLLFSPFSLGFIQGGVDLSYLPPFSHPLLIITSLSCLPQTTGDVDLSPSSIFFPPTLASPSLVLSFFSQTFRRRCGTSSIISLFNPFSPSPIFLYQMIRRI
jgi:hypothetical protein